MSIVDNCICSYLIVNSHRSRVRQPSRLFNIILTLVLFIVLLGLVLSLRPSHK